MVKVQYLKIYLLDINDKMVAAWREYFGGESNVELVCDDFYHFMNVTKVDCVVSPANAFGLMDGGYDLAITNWFGGNLQKKVQKYIIENLYGEQPVGTSIVIDTEKNGIKLIHTPSMRAPSPISDQDVVYQCMRTCLIAALQSGVKSMVIPAFGGLTGGLLPSTVARLMYRAYKQICNPPAALNWDYVCNNRAL